MVNVIVGQEVGLGWSDAKERTVRQLGIVKSVSAKGMITVRADDHHTYRYDADGLGKGGAWGTVFALEPGEKEKFLARKKQEQAERQAERDKKNAIQEDRYLRCLAWAEKHVTIQEVECVNCVLHIASIPGISEPTTLVIRFENNESVFDTSGNHKFTAYIGIHQTRKSGYTSGGSTNVNWANDKPMEMVALWMANWVYDDEIKNFAR